MEDQNNFFFDMSLVPGLKYLFFGELIGQIAEKYFTDPEDCTHQIIFDITQKFQKFHYRNFGTYGKLRSKLPNLFSFSHDGNTFEIPI